ncbi:CHC2 zinc finger domain-containing protein [Methylobacter sp.]|uniref:CHC2 zinc finger domain-containing protein n=1 Tax=Methylobacter sp. TaxID=2051955 RepID=UPI003DA5DA62
MPRIDYQKLIQNVSIDEVAKRLGMDLRKETTTRSKALCPFHDDRTPSLLIDSSRDHGPQHFHCFACGAHGDVIDLVKEQLKLGFREAVEWLASGSGNTAGHKRRVSTSVAFDSHSGLEIGYKMYKDGADNAKFEAWINERNLDAVVLRRAGFVYSSSNFLSQSFGEAQDTSEWREKAGLLEDAHLVRKIFPGVATTLYLPLKVKNQYSDFFIGERIVFPLYDEEKRLVGLGARFVGAARSSNSPKYQFTRGFPKATVLYRAESAFEQVRNEAKQGKKNIYLYLCEGFLDALRFEALEMPAVAVMGSSVSEHQVQLLQSLSDSLPRDATLIVVVCFDRDEAGLRGAADACLKLMHAPIECRFLWPQELQLEEAGSDPAHAKDPNDYLQYLAIEAAAQMIALATYPPELAVLASAFGVLAEDTLKNDLWENTPRSRRYRAFSQALNLLNKAGINRKEARTRLSALLSDSQPTVSALTEWISFIDQSTADAYRALSEDFLNNAKARLNHARILAYMGSRRGELPCDEPRWERLDIAATAFNLLLMDRLSSTNTEPIGPYDAVWVPRSFGGSEPRLKMMPRAEDLIIQQYLLNEILSERWDHCAISDTFSRMIPAVRYYREERKTVTTGFDKGDGRWSELNNRTLSFAYQIDMDVLEGRQPASDQGMYRPFSDCWRDFMKSLSKQASDIGYVYSIRLDVKRYYDRLRRYVVRDRLLSRLQSAIESVSGNTPGFAELLHLEASVQSTASNSKAAIVLDRIDEQLFGVKYRRPDNGLEAETDSLIGIPQGPVLSAWIGSVALFPVDEEAYRFMDRLNTDRERVGYARYVDDIVLLADSSSTLMEMRDAIDRRVRELELMLIAKADEIPPMSAEEFDVYINRGRALAVSGPAWEPPLVGDGESGWEFCTIAPTTDRQSALQLLHNVELYKASQSTLLQTIKTAFQAPDLRASELSKAARLIWYSIACEQADRKEPKSLAAVWDMYLRAWTECMQGSSWQLQPEKNVWESPILFALEGLEHLLDTTSRDVTVLSADENSLRRRRILWLANIALEPDFNSSIFNPTLVPEYQLEARFRLIRWKAIKISGQQNKFKAPLEVERSRLVQDWHPFEWMHKAIVLLSENNQTDKDPLLPFVVPAADQIRRGKMSGVAAAVFKALLPEDKEQSTTLSSAGELTMISSAVRVALQTLVSVVPGGQLLNYLNRRPQLIWGESSAVGVPVPKRLTLPPLPGITISRLFSCLSNNLDENGLVVAHGLEVIEFQPDNDALILPRFIGADGFSPPYQLNLEWRRRSVDGTNGILRRLNVNLKADDYLCLREHIKAIDHDVSVDVLKQTANLFKAITEVVAAYAQSDDDKEMVPAWPYIATSANGQFYYLIGDGVSRSELGNRAFVRDGGRALRTVEVPIYEASLWRVGVAISDYLGLHDDVTKFSSADEDLALDAIALANPARYVLRAQLRKLRGAYADSQISKRHTGKSTLPASIKRSLRLLETFPVEAGEPLNPLFHVLVTEAESAGMYLAFRERREHTDITSFLKALTNRVLARLPLPIGQVLATTDEKDKGLRRDFVGLLCFARRLFSAKATSPVVELQAWKVLCAGIVSAGISVAIDGLLASMRSHGDFERYDNFDFPSDWEIPEAESRHDDRCISEAGLESITNRSPVRVTLVDQLRRLVQHLGHRLYCDSDSNPQDCLSKQVIKQFKLLAQAVAEIESYGSDVDSLFEWPFEILSNRSLELLNLELLENIAELVKQIDKEIGFEVELVIEQSYGYNAQTRRFTDSRSGVHEVTPWMISQYPRNAKHIEEISRNGHFLRVWSEVFDRKTNKLLLVSALGEPFASIAILKPDSDALAQSEPEIKQQLGTLQEPTESGPQSAQLSNDDRPFTSQIKTTPISHEKVSADDNANQREGEYSFEANSVSANSGLNAEQQVLEKKILTADSREKINQVANAFHKTQFGYWKSRGSRPNGHVRVALLQANFDLTYKHPFVEACPSNWPFSSDIRADIAHNLKSNSIYGPLLRANERSESGHHWIGYAGDAVNLPSWSEHRRQRILARVIDSCEELGVDLLVLPEYSVRRETVEWLKSYIANKSLSVLAGTHMDFRKEPVASRLAAPLTLLWPVPEGVSRLLTSALQRKDESIQENTDSLKRGLVLEFSRNKKYRSIALEEFFSPFSGQLFPLFKLDNLPKELIKQAKLEPSTEALVHMLANTRLPLKHLLELICSEIFLVTSPANYLHMMEDLRALRRRFGHSTDEEEVFKDVKELSSLLPLTGNGIHARRSILAVPAATSRSADYWIAGQAGFLSAGTTTVFCNSIDGKTIVGGSCFIGRGSWKSEENEIGYISMVTPYHGWSKGIYYNSKADALSRHDQAVVVADIDPYNMLEGKPRAQTMPSPLQLVAYLPLIETVDWACTEANLLQALSLPKPRSGIAPVEKVKTRAQDEEKFWNSVREANTKPDKSSLNALWEKFPDPGELISRTRAYMDNGYMQPTSIHSSGMFETPAYYDWIDVSLTLTEKQELPEIAVPPWRERKD